MKNQTTTTVSGTDRIVSAFADMMIKTINELQHGWRKTWITMSANGRPMNFCGREYNRMNEFFLYLYCESRGYKYPVFMTLKKANELGAHIKQGEKSVPVLFWMMYFTDKNGKRISEEEYDNLPASLQKECKKRPVLKYYNVFNVDQTDIADVQPEKLGKLIAEHFAEPAVPSADGMYANRALDSMVEKQNWVCPIVCKRQDRAFYSPLADSITLPEKAQFNIGADAWAAGQEYYSTMLHEMAHSTGSEKRLNRLENSSFGSESYAKEELVAELTAALVGHSLGFNTSVRDNNAAYLGSWLKTMKKEPKFLVSVLSDVSKAAAMIEQHISSEQQEVA